MGYMIAVERIDEKAVAIHHLHMPSLCEKGCYKQVRSYEAFQKAMRTRLCKFKGVDGDLSKGIYLNRTLPGQYFYTSWADDFEITRKHCYGIYDGLTEHHWNSIYDFFAAIKYDRKKRKLESWL